MRKRYRFLRKSYAMNRMASAIERAIQAPTAKEKERAARWAAAWGLLSGIKNLPVKLRRSEVEHWADGETWRPSEQDEFAHIFAHAAEMESLPTFAMDGMASETLQGKAGAAVGREDAFLSAGNVGSSNAA
jgi:hypothetical protein